MSSAEILLSAGSPNWQTPPEVVEAARACMGGIDLDPASCVSANRTVQANEYFDAADDGLSRNWHGNVFLNPPGGKPPQGAKIKSNPVLWWAMLLQEHAVGRAEQAIFVVFAAGSFFQAVQRLGQARSPFHHHICWCKDRLRFRLTVAERITQLEARPLSKRSNAWHIERAKLAAMPLGATIEGPQPTHSNAIIGVGVSSSAFVEAFQSFGQITKGSLLP